MYHVMGWNESRREWAEQLCETADEAGAAARQTADLTKRSCGIYFGGRMVGYCLPGQEPRVDAVRLIGAKP